MFRAKRARSVVHSLAHHGVGSMSWLHPRLGEDAKAQNIQEISYNFCLSTISTESFEASLGISGAFSSLQETFERIAEAENLHISELKDATITFGFLKWEWSNYCICSVTSSDGEVVRVKVDGFGRKYTALSQYYNCG